MGRPPRVSAPDTVYHVICRGNNRQAIFTDNRDYFRYLDLWRQNKAEMDFQVFAYVLMTNHVHWLLKTGITPLSEIIHRIHSTYARWFNHRHERAGHLFQGRYKNMICTDEAYLLALARYIHQNPIRSGLVKKLHLYPWSSYHLYISGREDGLVETDLLLNYFSTNKQKARLQFMEYCQEPDDTSYPGKTAVQKERRQATPSSKKELYDEQGDVVNASGQNTFPVKAPSNLIISPSKNNTNCFAGSSAGDSPDSSTSIAAGKSKGSTTNKSTYASDKQRTPAQDLDQIALWIERATGVSLSELKGNSQKKHVVLARSLFVKIAVSKAGIKRSIVADYLGKERSMITKVLDRWSNNRVSKPAIDLLQKFSSNVSSN